MRSPAMPTVTERTFLGSLTRLRVTLDDGVALLIDAASRRDLPAPGARVDVRVTGEDALIGGAVDGLAAIEDVEDEPLALDPRRAAGGLPARRAAQAPAAMGLLGPYTQPPMVLVGHAQRVAKPLTRASGG